MAKVEKIEEWEIQDALRTLIRAEQIMQDKGMMIKVVKLAQREVESINAVLEENK